MALIKRAIERGHRKGAIRLGRGQIGRDTRQGGDTQCLECRVKSMEKINTDTTFVALDKTFLKQRDRCDENATTEGRLLSRVDVSTRVLACFGSGKIGCDRSASMNMEMFVRVFYILFSFYLLFSSLMFR